MEFAHIFTLSVSVVTAINILLAGILIFIERRDIGSTWAWLLILFFYTDCRLYCISILWKTAKTEELL